MPWELVWQFVTDQVSKAAKGEAGVVATVVVAGLFVILCIFLWQLPNLIRAIRGTAGESPVQQAAPAQTPPPGDAASMRDWLRDLDGRVTKLESRPAEFDGRLDWEKPAGSPSTKLTLMLRNASTQRDASDVDVRVIRKDGQACKPILVLSGATFAAGARVQVPWPDAAGAASSYVLRVNWFERGELVDTELVVWHPSN